METDIPVNAMDMNYEEPEVQTALQDGAAGLSTADIALASLQHNSGWAELKKGMEETIEKTAAGFPRMMNESVADYGARRLADDKLVEYIRGLLSYVETNIVTVRSVLEKQG